MTPKMYQQLVDKIVEAVPEIKETKRGCFICILYRKIVQSAHVQNESCHSRS